MELKHNSLRNCTDATRRIRGVSQDMVNKMNRTFPVDGLKQYTLTKTVVNVKYNQYCSISGNVSVAGSFPVLRLAI